MKRKLKFVTLLTILALVFTMASPLTSTTARAASVKISKSKLTLDSGSTYTLKLKGTKKAPTWKSSKKAVATVNKKGKITAKKAGKATITATLGGKKYTCSVKVVPAISDHQILMNVGNEWEIEVLGVDKSKVTWESENPSLVKVENGLITALGYTEPHSEEFYDEDGEFSHSTYDDGSVKITATYAGKEYYCYILVYNWFESDTKSIDLKVGETKTIRLSEHMTWDDLPFTFTCEWSPVEGEEKTGKDGLEISWPGEWIFIGDEETSPGSYACDMSVKGLKPGHYNLIVYNNILKNEYYTSQNLIGYQEYVEIPVTVTE